MAQLKAPKSEAQRNREQKTPKFTESLNCPMQEGTIQTSGKNNHVFHEMQNLDEHHDKIGNFVQGQTYSERD